MSLQISQLAVEDFSGGITDYTIDAKPNQSAELNNLLIDPNKKLLSSPGSQVFDPNMFVIPSGNNRVGGLFTSLMYPELFINSAKKIWVPNSTSFLELTGSSGNSAFSSGSVNSIPSFTEWNYHVIAVNSDLSYPVKMYKDNSDVWKLRTAGLPEISAPTVTSTGGTGNSYVYTFLYYYTYTVGSTVFEDFGATTQVRVSNVGAPNTNAVNITSIPVIINGTTLNYDTANIKVYIYRTKNAGTVSYKVGQVTNGTTTFSDTMADTALEANLLLYTNSGVLDNDAPPRCKYVTTVNNITYYGYVVQDGQTLKNRVRQSAQDDPDSCPRESYIDLLDEVTGLSSFNDNPIFFTKNHAYRINGAYSETGQGQVTYEDITKTIGCVSHNSIVQTRLGVFWAGNDGIYHTDGFNFKKVSDSINERYKTIVSDSTKASRIYGTYDTKDNRVYFAVSSAAGTNENDAFLVLDLRWGVRDDATFTTRGTGTSFAPTAVTFYNKQLIHSDYRGYILKHDSSFTTDPKIDTAINPSLWDTVGIVPYYKSTVFNFGMPNVRKWVTKVLLSLQNKSNISAQIISINDDGNEGTYLKEIRYRGNFNWGEPNPIWGVTIMPWSFSNLIQEMRRFVAKSLRCSYKQVVITQSVTNIFNSDNFVPMDVDASFHTATSSDNTTIIPTNLSGYFISFENDNYTVNYPIIERVSDTQLKFSDNFNSAVTGNYKWVIKGTPKGEIMNIISYIMYFAPLTDQSFKTWRNEQDSTGGNA
jgi:hypothetical protein